MLSTDISENLNKILHHAELFYWYIGIACNSSDILLINSITYDFYSNGFSEKTNKEISKEINKSLSTVEKIVNKLKKNGFIITCVTRKGEKKARRRIYPNNTY